MDGWDEECRQAAEFCLEKAKDTVDQATRVELLIIAQRWLDLANRPILGHVLQRSETDRLAS